MGDFLGWTVGSIVAMLLLINAGVAVYQAGYADGWKDADEERSAIEKCRDAKHKGTKSWQRKRS